MGEHSPDLRTYQSLKRISFPRPVSEWLSWGALSVSFTLERCQDESALAWSQLGLHSAAHPLGITVGPWGKTATCWAFPPKLRSLFMSLLSLASFLHYTRFAQITQNIARWWQLCTSLTQGRKGHCQPPNTKSAIWRQSEELMCSLVICPLNHSAHF